MDHNDLMITASIIDSIAGLYAGRQQKRNHSLAELIPAIASNKAVSREQNRLKSHDLNVFRFFNPGETTHSRLLAYFLDPRASHGQGPLFLVEFLRLLKISQPDSASASPWIVTAEIGRVDVLIKRMFPHTVVVIENKSNYAYDQPNQLYRYWYQEIYRKQLERHAPSYDLINPSKNHYRIVYLSPESWKQADKQSVSKPSNLSAELPETVPENIIEHHLFKDLVTEWLKNSLALIAPDNHRLREFTEQYIQFWHSN
ncbi:PD-(D/E)XK nuclease family protein [Hymenobacter yonginensis]|uniref:PD-(D/E)XK nuclease family protein n=1 Tax=Hymenobacter yonginensis TaxID=748197 RepID=A0ABY7PQQ5_9BACT|nr:PD-(D/E)XK nuclease family protein [Hymenobacter yonginensis]WBO85239.1 PD-(D/E)XK nuclease family protein [Hymenobacter yonginensis]